MNGFNEFKKQRLAELAKKDKGSATSALPIGVSRAIDAAKAGQNPVSSFQVDDKKEKSEVITPNARNYDSFKDFKRDFLGAKAGIIEFKSGAYNHGVDFDYLTSLDKDIGDFFKEQDEALKNNPFGDTAASDAADAKIAEFKERLANVVKYRMENAKWLEKRELGNYRSPMQSARIASALASGEPITDFSKDMNVTPGVKRDEDLAAVDAFISGANAQLKYIEDAWNNAKVTYIHFGNDEAAYKDALMRSRHEYETFDEVKAALANPGRVSRMSAEELEYLSNYGLRHGYSDPAEYDKEIAELWGKIEFGGAEYGKGTDIGKVLRRKIESLEAARDRTAAYNEAWRAYTPFFNAEDFEAQSQYRGGGGLLGEYINLSDSEITALMSGGTEYNRLDYLLDSDEVKEFVNLNIALLGEEEISMYNYLVNTQGEEAAKVFLNTITPLVAERTRENNSKLLTKFAKEHPIIGTGVSFLTTAGSALLAPGQLIANIFGAEDTAQDLGILADVTGTLRGGASEYFEEDLGLGGAGKVGYDVLTSVVDMLIARKLAGLTAGAGTQKLSAGLTQAIMSSEAASSTMADANRRGLSGLQAAALGVGSAAIEWLTEKYSIEALMSKPTSALRYWAKNVIAEGSEEAVSEIAGEMLDRVIAGDKSETMMRYLELVEGGMDPKEASRKVLLDNLKDVGLAALTGALAGGIQSGHAAIGYAIDTRRAERRAGGNVRRTDDAQFIINEGLKAAPGTELHKLAEKAQAELSKKGKVSDGTIGKIVMEGGEAISNAYAQHNENKKYFRDSDNIEADTENGAVESAENVAEAFDDAEVREAAEREKSPIIDLDGVVAGSARATKTTERRRVDISTLSKDAQVRARGVESVAKLFGKRVNFYESDAGDNGYYNRIDNSINVNVYAKNPYLVVFGHELTHGTEAAAKIYSQLETAVERYMNKKNGDGDFASKTLALQESRAKRGREFAVSYEGAKREIVANFISEKLFTDEATVKEFIRENRSVGQRILETVRAMLRKVTKGKAGYGTLKDIERIYAKALRETAKLDKARSKMIRSTEEKQQTVKEIARELGEKLHSGEITEEEYDRLFDERVASTPEFRGEVAAEARGVMGFADSSAEGAVNQEKRFDVGEDVQWSIGEIYGKNGYYGEGVILDSTLLSGLTPDERVKKVKECLKNLGGKVFTAYDENHNAIDIRVVKSNIKFVNKNGKRTYVNKDLTSYLGNEFKQESIILIDELISTSSYSNSEKAKYPHDWLDDNGKNEWEYWKTYLKDKENTILEATLNIANTINGEKILYDIYPIKIVERSGTSDAISTTDSISQSPDSVNRQFSVSGDEVDSQGRKLSEGQIEYFKDSKVRDENGALKVMYHGTPNGDFTVFKDGTYFTENKWYADLYQNPGASSISYGKSVTNPKTYEVYLDIKKPFDISDPEARSIYINDYIKGGNAAGINPYQSDAEYDKINSIDWTEGEDLREFLKENDYDYDGLVLDEGATGGYGEDVKYRGKSYVIFDHSQVKNADNVNPTSDPDIRFSVSGDDEVETLAAVEAQGRELLDSYIDTEAPPEVKHEYTENNVNYPTTDYLRGRFVGYDTAADAIKALAQGRLSNKKALELAELIGMPEVANEKGEVSPIIPFRTYFIINSLGTYKRRDTGAEVPVVGYALPAADENGVWLHYYNGETKDYINQYYTFDELTRTKAQHVATRAEWDAYLEFIEEGGNEAVPSDLAPTEEDLSEWHQSDNAFTVITPEQMNAAQGIYDRMKPKERNYVDRSMRNFRAEVAKILSIPMSQSGRTAIIEAGDELAADFFNNGTFGPSVIEKTFEKLFAESVVINDDFYQQYKDVLADLRSVKLLISEEDANELAGGLGAFKKKAMGLIMSVSYRRDGRSGTTVDSYYGELSGSHPELFPSDIVHPAAQLDQMLNVAREISKAKSFAEAPTEESKAAMLNEYVAAVGTLGHPLSNAIKQSVESELLSAVAGDAFRSEAEEILELGTKIPGMIREIKKLQYKLLLSDHDVQVVGDLLAGYVTEDAVRKAEFNANEIIRMYEAQKPYREATKRMQEYRAKVNDNNRAIAEKVMGDIMKWDSSKKFANIMFNFMDLPRIIREIAPDEETANLFIKTYIDPLRRESADRVRYVNEIRERVKKMGLSRKIRKGDKISESAAVQILGEARAAQAMLEERMNKNKDSAKQYKRDGQTLEEWKRDEEALWEANPSFKDSAVRKRIEDAVKEFREIYDKLHHDMNRTLVDNALSPVQYRAGYFPHFEKEIDNKFITRVLSFMGFAKEVQVLPTEIAGRTGDFRPNRQWFGNAMQRAVNNREQQKETVLFDAVEGLDRYIESASSIIFHTTSISRFRALERYIRTATADGELKNQIERIEQSTTLSEDEKNAAIADQTRNRPFALSAFAQFLLEYTNKLAGKQSIIDRGVENLFGREVFNVSRAITKKYAVNATSSLSSALTNLLPLAQGSGGYRFWDLAGAVWDIMRNADVGDESDFVVSREGTSRLVKTKLEKGGDIARWLFEFIDSNVTRSAVQARYRYNLGRGIDNEAALYEADSWARALIGDRGTGMQPLAFESNNPFIKVFTQFQLEVNNQLLRLLKDTPGEFKGRMDLHDNKAAGVADAVYHVSKAAFFTWLLNGAYEKIVGRGPGGDILGIIFDAIAAGTGFDLFEWMFQWVPGIDEDEDDEGDGFFAGVGELFAGTAEELPFLGSVLDGGRVPISSALPDVKILYNAFTDEDASWQYKAQTAFSELSTPLLYMVMPFGASQVKKTGQFVNDLVHGGAYAYDKEGNPKLKYPVEGFADIARGLFFGYTATTGGHEWIEGGFGSLSATQTQAYEAIVDTGVGRYDAYDVVDGLRKLENKDDPEKNPTNEQKAAYVRELDMSDEAKAALYAYMVASKDSKERALLLGANELGVTPGVIYRQIAGFDEIEEEFGEGHDGEKEQAKVDMLADAEVLESAKPQIYLNSVSSGSYDKLIDAGVDAEKAADVAWEIAKLLPLEGKKSVSSIQKASVVLRNGAGEEAAAAFLVEDTREKLSAVSEYGASVRGYVALKEYLLYNDEDGGAPSMEEARKAINAISRGSVVSVPGMPDVALELTSSEKAALWQMMNSAWKPEKNPFSTSVGRKVYNALNALKEEEE